MNINDATDAVVSALEGAEIPASIDPADVNVPGAWVAAREVDVFTAGGGALVTVDVYLIAPDIMPRDAMDELSALSTRALDALDIEAMSTNDALQLPDGGRPKPAFKITTKVEV